MDVKIYFMHGDLQEEIYMEQPLGFVQDSSLVYRRNLHGIASWFYARFFSCLQYSTFTIWSQTNSWSLV
jgi:hypothetical protein